jgi:VIT1/CCC1 family predicted Fe2+/Mn2+ transporter
LSARSEHDLFKADSSREAYEMEHEPDEEKWELKWIYMDKGLTEQEADMVVSRLLTNKEKFLEDMLMNELHVHEHNLQNPYKLGAVIGLSFLIGSFVPLAPTTYSPRSPTRSRPRSSCPWSSSSPRGSGRGAS